MALSEDDIQRITRAVLAQVQSRVDGASVARAVDTVLRDPHRVDSVPPVSKDLSTRPSSAVHPEFERTDGEGRRVIVAAFGRNRPGVAAALTAVLAEHSCDIADITQKILQEFFSMIMIVDITRATVDFATLRQKFQEVESRLGITIVAQHEDVFRAMHRI